MKKLETKSCEEIMNTAYKPLEYCVDGLLTQGLYLVDSALFECGDSNETGAGNSQKGDGNFIETTALPLSVL